MTMSVRLLAAAAFFAATPLLVSPPAHAQRAPAPRASAAASASAAPSARSGAQLLRMNYTAGQRIHYATRNTQTVPGGGDVTQNLGVDLETTAVQPDGSASQRYRIASITVNAPGIPAAVQQRISSSMTGLTIDYTQAPTGRITARQPASNVAPELRPMIDSALQALDQFSPQLPTRPVSVGDSWDDRRTLTSTMGPGMTVSINLDVHYTLRALDNGQATIDLRMTMAVPAGTLIQGVSFSGNGTATGTLTLDLARGFARLIESQGAMDLTAAQGAQNRQIRTQFSNQMRAENAPAPGAAAPSAAARRP